jgi:hypothetical protein
MINKVKMVCVAVLCLLLTANISVEAQVPAYVPTDGLVGWWDFNGQLDDQHGSAMTFSLTGSTQLGLDKDENPQSALQLLGDGSAYTDNNGSIPQYSAMTLSYWIKLDGGTAVALALGASTGQSWSSFFSNNNGQAGVGYGAGCAGTSGGVNVSGAESYGGEWHHVVMAVGGTNQPYSVYVDGELLGVGNANTAGGCNTSQLHLGVDIWSLPEYMIGFLDDLGVWDRVLTPEEVSELFQAATAGCVDPSACNYNADATEDDGSCDPGGCTDPSACNYNEEAGCEDGSCIFPPSIDLGEDIETCEEAVTLDAGPGFDSYLWSTGETTQTIEVSESGDYSVEVGNASLGDEFSMSFDGNDRYVEIPHTNTLTFVSEENFAISAWLKRDLSSGDSNQIIVSKGSGGDPENFNYEISLNQASSHIEFMWEFDGGSDVILTGGSVDDEQWHLITCLWDGTAQSIYIDGVLSATQTGINGPGVAMDRTIKIGSRSSSRSFSGEIERVEIWNTTLTQPEIQQYMQCPPTGDEEGLVGYWNFNEGSGTTAIDLSGNGNDGTIIGATYSEDVPDSDCTNCSSTDSVSVTFLSSGCTDPQACNYNEQAGCDDGSCFFANAVFDCEGNCQIDLNNNGVCDQLETGGCSGPGCCGNGTLWDPIQGVCIAFDQCPADVNEDQVVDALDILALIASYGSDCP